MEYVAIFCSAVALAAVVMVYMQLRNEGRQRDNARQQATDYVKSDIAQLTRAVQEFEQVLSQRLDGSQQVVQQSLQKQLGQSNELVRDITERLSRLDETNRRVVDVAEELKTLQTVLQNPKQRGVFGEYYLQSVLDNILPPHHYQMQYAFSDGTIVDAALFLDKGKVLPVDSKFSLENYNRLVAAEDEEQRRKFRRLVRSDLKRRIDETSKYIRPEEGTMEFAFMFIPSESLYYDLLVGSVGSQADARDLVEYAFRDRKVIVVSPTSFMAYLQTVLQGLRSLQIEEQAKEIQRRVVELGRHINQHEQAMQKLGRSLGTSVARYNDAHKALARIDKDVVRITGDPADSPGVQPYTLEAPDESTR